MDNRAFKNFWFWVVLVLVIGAGFYLKINLPSSKTVLSQQARLVVDLGGGKKRVFEAVLHEDTTVLRALYSASSNDGLNFRYYINKNGDIVLMSMLGAIDFKGASWHFYFNQMLIKTAELDRVRVRTGDLIEARYEK